MMKAIENLLRAPNHPFNLALQMFTTTFFGLKCYVIYWPKPRYCFLFRLYFDRFSIFLSVNIKIVSLFGSIEGRVV